MGKFISSLSPHEKKALISSGYGTIFQRMLDKAFA